MVSFSWLPSVPSIIVSGDITRTCSRDGIICIWGSSSPAIRSSII